MKVSVTVKGNVYKVSCEVADIMDSITTVANAPGITVTEEYRHAVFATLDILVSAGIIDSNDRLTVRVYLNDIFNGAASRFTMTGPTATNCTDCRKCWTI